MTSWIVAHHSLLITKAPKPRYEGVSGGDLERSRIANLKRHCKHIRICHQTITFEPHISRTGFLCIQKKNCFLHQNKDPPPQMLPLTTHVDACSCFADVHTGAQPFPTQDESLQVQVQLDGNPQNQVQAPNTRPRRDHDQAQEANKHPKYPHTRNTLFFFDRGSTQPTQKQEARPNPHKNKRIGTTSQPPHTPKPRA
jgi:hypothetical protein